MNGVTYPQQATVTAAADGTATAQIFVSGLQRWQLHRVGVSIPSVSNLVIVPCRTYRNFVSPGNQVGATRTGQLDTDDDPRCTLGPGESFIAAWESVTPGAACTLTLAYEIA